jgi:hypothetical protein
VMASLPKKACQHDAAEAAFDRRLST